MAASMSAVGPQLSAKSSSKFAASEKGLGASGETYVLIAFKCCVEVDDHIMNKFAVWQTKSQTRLRHRGDTNEDPEKEFRGRMSHVEILIKKKTAHDTEKGSEWHRYSIMKKTGRRVGGKIVFKPGVVHCVKTGYVNGEMQVKNYRFYRVELGAQGVCNALAFLEKEVHRKSGFNKLGYLFNFASPMLFGVCHYRQAERKDKNTWFCTELIVCALQAAGMATFELRKACAISPNEMFDLVAGDEGRLVFSGDYF
jgi:hypothetical protein